MERLLPYGHLAAARPGDAFLESEVVPDRVEHAWGVRDSVVWIAPSAYHRKRWLIGRGEAHAVGALAADALAGPAGPSVAGLSLPDGAIDLLPEDLRPARVERWTWWVAQEPPEGSDDEAVVRLADDDARIPPLLGQSSSVYLHPGDARVQQWLGLVEDGQLRACLAVERHHPLVPHLASVVVDGRVRQRGYGGRLCGTVVRQLFAEGAPAVSLAMMRDNHRAAALYLRLGFAPVAEFTSGTIPGRRNLPPVDLADAGERP